MGVRTMAVLVVAVLVLAGCGATDASDGTGYSVETSPNSHSVIVHYSLSGDDFGTAGERDTVFDLEDRVIAIVEDQGLGEYDGNEFGDGEYILYLYGPDAGRLFAGVEDVLREFPARPAYAILRFGEYDDPDAVEKRIDF